MKSIIRNIVLWFLMTLFIIAVLIGILCWTGVIPSTFLTAPIRKMTNGLMGVLLLALKILPTIKTIVEKMLQNIAKKLLLNPLFWFGECLWALLTLKRPPPYYRAFDKFYNIYIDPHILRFGSWCESKLGKAAEWLLNLCGYKIWPKTHNDPTIKGPPPRILTNEQVKEFERTKGPR